ncbi:hypothetical protein PHLGIDRAFT_138535 [Phlebiopsis gigantea 11061_1 CR5-6]|uniref:Uncharacterized protein n=1 Tax=Phlebiopsis gigantea (strain 11061_1 CR5-6) TaxID=745531 RepID=A0A0C3SFY3_PHLG1|nr:hypothetical protein PHLGIDRAFT_138535 [Phlebiopsis gigantea 11061_1 CR5-6]
MQPHSSPVDGSVAVHDAGCSYSELAVTVEGNVATGIANESRETSPAFLDQAGLPASQNGAYMQSAEVPQPELNAPMESPSGEVLGHPLEANDSPSGGPAAEGGSTVDEGSASGSAQMVTIEDADRVALSHTRDLVPEETTDPITLPIIVVTDETDTVDQAAPAITALSSDANAILDEIQVCDPSGDMEDSSSAVNSERKLQGAYMQSPTLQVTPSGAKVVQIDEITKTTLVDGEGHRTEDNTLGCEVEVAEDVKATPNDPPKDTDPQASLDCAMPAVDVNSEEHYPVEDLVSPAQDDFTEHEAEAQLPSLLNTTLDPAKTTDQGRTLSDGLLPPLPSVIDHLLLLGEAYPSLPTPHVAPSLHPDLADLTLSANNSTSLGFPILSCLGLTLHADENLANSAHDLDSLAPADPETSLDADLAPLADCEADTTTDTMTTLAYGDDGMQNSPRLVLDALPTCGASSDIDLLAESASRTTLATFDAPSARDRDTPLMTAVALDLAVPDSPLQEPAIQDLSEKVDTSSTQVAEVNVPEVIGSDLPADIPPNETDALLHASEKEPNEDTPLTEGSTFTPIATLDYIHGGDFTFTPDVAPDSESTSVDDGDTNEEEAIHNEEQNDDGPPSPGLPPSSPPSSQVSDLFLPLTEEGAEPDLVDSQHHEPTGGDGASERKAAEDDLPLPSSQPRSSSPDRVFSSPPPYDFSSPPTSPQLLPDDGSKEVVEDTRMLDDANAEPKVSSPAKKRPAEDDLREDVKRVRTIERYTPPPPPNPKRATLLGQKKQQRKLVQPFRSPIVKLNDILAGKDGVYASGRARPAEKRFGSEPREDAGSGDDFGASTSSATESPGANVAAAATKDRTARAGKPFKSVVLNVGKTDVCLTAGATSGVKTGSTIQALQARVQKLKQAIRIRDEREAESERCLEVLVSKWRSVGRDVAWLVWDTVKDLDPGDSLKVLPTRGGWGEDDDVRRTGKSKGKGCGGGFQSGWGWNDEKGGDGKTAGFNSNWGWDDKKEDGPVNDDQADVVDEQMEVEEDVPVQNHSLGTMLRHMGVDPETLGWDEDEGDFVGEP